MLFSQIPPELPEKHTRAQVGSKPAEPQLQKPGGFVKEKRMRSNEKQKKRRFSHQTSRTGPVYLSGGARACLNTGCIGHQDRKPVKKKQSRFQDSTVSVNTSKLTSCSESISVSTSPLQKPCRTRKPSGNHHICILSEWICEAAVGFSQHLE